MQSYLKAAPSEHSRLLLSVKLHWVPCSQAMWRCISHCRTYVLNISQTHAALDQWTGRMSVCNVCCYVGSMPKCFREKKECCANPLQRPSQKVEYLLWAVWFSVLAFGIKVGRLKRFPGISWWSHFRWIKSWPDKAIYKTDRGKDIRSCSLSSPASTIVLCVKRQTDGKRGCQ